MSLSDAESSSAACFSRATLLPERAVTLLGLSGGAVTVCWCACCIVGAARCGGAAALLSARLPGCLASLRGCLRSLHHSGAHWFGQLGRVVTDAFRQSVCEADAFTCGNAFDRQSQELSKIDIRDVIPPYTKVSADANKPLQTSSTQLLSSVVVVMDAVDQTDGNSQLPHHSCFSYVFTDNVFVNRHTSCGCLRLFAAGRS